MPPAGEGVDLAPVVVVVVADDDFMRLLFRRSYTDKLSIYYV